MPTPQAQCEDNMYVKQGSNTQIAWKNDNKTWINTASALWFFPSLKSFNSLAVSEHLSAHI